MYKLKGWASFYSFLSLLILSVQTCAQEKSDLYYFQTDHRYNYITELLKLALVRQV